MSLSKRFRTNGIEIAYEVVGDGPPLLMLAGLAGLGRSWGPQIELLAKQFTLILPDHRGTGGSTRTVDGMTIVQHASDLVQLANEVANGPYAVLGSSTGGAIAQTMAIQFGEQISAVVMANTLARSDAYYDRQFEVRKSVLRDSGLSPCNTAISLLLFSPKFTRENPNYVQQWIDTASAAPLDIEIALARIDMITRHDELDRLSQIECPALVIGGADDSCTPPYFSEELAKNIPGAALHIMNTGHFSFLEKAEDFAALVTRFIHSIPTQQPYSVEAQ